MRLHPLAQAYLEKAAAEDAGDFRTQSVAVQRADHSRSILVPKDRQAPVHSVENRSFPAAGGEITLRIYRSSSTPELPLYVFVHGGGWVLGDLEPYDYVCRGLTSLTDSVMVSVGYRRAPEHRHPGPLEDVTSAILWCFDNLEYLGADGRRTVIGGDSAGGHLATTYCLRAVSEGMPVFSRQVLHYPVTAHYSAGFASYETFGRNCGLDKERMIWFWDQFLPADAELNHPLVSPLYAENLRELPRTLIQTAGCDPLRDEGVAYAEKLKNAGVSTEWSDYEGMIHGFINIPELGFGSAAMQEVASFLSDL